MHNMYIYIIKTLHNFLYGVDTILSFIAQKSYSFRLPKGMSYEYQEHMWLYLKTCELK